MSADELARAARELLAAASTPITFPQSDNRDEWVLVPGNYLDFLRTALDPEWTPYLRPESDWFKGNCGELIEVRYLHIPDVAADEIDEIVCGPVHLETLSEGNAYIRVAGLMVRIQAIKGRLSITCEPDDCTPLPPTSQQQREAAG